MSIKRILAVGAIFVTACAGWWILGTATAVRSTGFLTRLGSEVEKLWGSPLAQQAPTLAVQIPGTEQYRYLMPSANDIKVRLDTDYRRKGLIWYPTYTCSFDGAYTITNQEEVTLKVRLHFDFPGENLTYDNFSMTLDEQAVKVSSIDTSEGISEIVELAPGTANRLRVTYRTRGIRNWRYSPAPRTGRVRNLQLAVETGFEDIDYTEGSLSPMDAQSIDGGMQLTWSATDLITREDVGIVIPEKLNPGPLTSRITFFAPVCLIFFFVLVAAINILYKIDIHPMHYLFVAAGFFAFHLLLAYLVGMVNVHVSFAISAITSVTLVTTYLSAALKGKLPWKVAAAGQIFFLVLFSYSFFLKGTTGLTVAIGSVVTLAVLMRLTARVDWNEVFAKPAKPKNTPPPLNPTPAVSVGPAK